MQKFHCRVAPSLGALEATHQEAWGTEEYVYPRDRREPTVFFGLYDLRDYLALWRHKGKAWVLWAGSDLENLIHGFAFNDGRLRRLSVISRGVFTGMLHRLLRRAEHYVEDDDEAHKLEDSTGILPRVVPSFLGRAEHFPVSYRHAFHPNVYVSGHPDREKEYGFEFVDKIAQRVPECIFHLYGAEWVPTAKNVICHGRVPKEVFNRDIKGFQCGLRLNDSDGFSEITAKAILMGQYAITKLYYPMIPTFDTTGELVSLLKSLRSMRHPNHAARNYYLRALNRYPWVRRNT